MESFCTDFNGLTRWIPSGSVSPVTRPNSVSTPTFPVGIEVVLASTRIITSTRIASCNILFPAPRKFGIAGNPPPPNSNLVGFGIFSSVSRLDFAVRSPHHRHSVVRQTTIHNFPARSRRPSTSPAFLFRYQRFGLQVPQQPYHNIL